MLVLADPYANAHNKPGLSGPSPNVDDMTSRPGYGPSRIAAMVPGIFERKYELDSLCAFLKLRCVAGPQPAAKRSDGRGPLHTLGCR